jgi:hypothetical protein
MSKWRDTYKVNPSSDCFPIMSQDELDALAAEDPADPRGACEDDGVKIIRHRAWDYMSDEALRMAEAFLAEHGHRAIAQADDRVLMYALVRRRLVGVTNNQRSVNHHSGQLGCAAERLLLAHRVISLPRSNRVAFGVKRTSTVGPAPSSAQELAPPTDAGGHYVIVAACRHRGKPYGTQL